MENENKFSIIVGCAWRGRDYVLRWHPPNLTTLAWVIAALLAYHYWFSTTATGLPGTETIAVDSVLVDETSALDSTAAQLSIVPTQPIASAEDVDRKLRGSPSRVAYVKRFLKVAQAERAKYAIPVSVSLAQGILESKAGSSTLAREHNNHFGVKCHRNDCEPGHCVNVGDDTHKDFFRVYPSAWASWRSRSIVLRKRRYRKLFDLPQNDYKAWAHGLKAAGYATDPRYAEKLIAIIEEMNLAQYDQ